MVMSAVSGSSTVATVAPVTNPSPIVENAPNTPSVAIMSTEDYVKQYFSDIPIMVHIADCESTYRQLDPDGSVHRGKENNEDVGVMQINEHYNGAQAEKEGYDIYTLQGNVAFARELYDEKGTKPWDSSKACWGKFQNDDTNGLAVNTK